MAAREEELRLQEAAKALAAAARREKEANLTKLLDEFGIQHEDARNLAAAGVRTVEDLIILDEEDLEGLSLSLPLSVVNKKKLIKGVRACVRVCVFVCVRDLTLLSWTRRR